MRESASLKCTVNVGAAHSIARKPAGRPLDDFEDLRVNLVSGLKHRQIRDPRVLDAMRAIPRHHFVPAWLRYRAYEQRALSIGCGQTTPVPYLVAVMLEALELRGAERVLEVGTGSGYQAALLARLASRVISLEISRGLGADAKRYLAGLGIRNVRVAVRDGCLGDAASAPYGAILVSAAAPQVPEPLVAQLADGGRLVMPIGTDDEQMLVRVTRLGGAAYSERLTPCLLARLTHRH